jgi:NitT/TauT family transport system substrate-binding protein
MAGWRFRCALAAGALLALTLGPAQGAEPLKIRAGWVVTPATMTPILFARPEILKHYGSSYVVDTVHFGATSHEIAALALEDVDIASLAFSSFGAAVMNAHLDDLRIVADGFQDGVPGYYTSEYMVRKDSPIATVADLKGKVLASNGVGGAIDMALRDMLRQHGLEDRKDYTIVEAQFPAMAAMLEERKVDLVGVVPPFAYDPRLRDNARVLFTMKEAVGRTQMIVWAARTPFLGKNRAALADFFEDALRALRWYLDPKNRAAAIETVSQVTKQPPERFAPWLFTTADYYRDPAARPDLDALQRNVETQQKLGFLKESFDVRDYADLSFVEEAARRLR